MRNISNLFLKLHQCFSTKMLARNNMSVLSLYNVMQNLKTLFDFSTVRLFLEAVCLFSGKALTL